MSERSAPPELSQFPELTDDESWTTVLQSGTMFARIFNASGSYPTEWHNFRHFGPVDARFDPHPLPTGLHEHHAVMYAVAEGNIGSESAITACIVEVFQHLKTMDLSRNAPTLALFQTTRPVTLLNLSDSDWLTVAGGSAAISSGSRSMARAWSRAIHHRYPEIDGVMSASSVMPTARITALWHHAIDAIPHHPDALLRLDRPELTNVINRVAERFGYLVL